MISCIQWLNLHSVCVDYASTFLLQGWHWLKLTKYQKGRTSLPSIHIHSPTRSTCSLLSHINTIKRPRFDFWPGFRYYITSASSSRMKSSLKQRPAGSFVTIWYSGTDFHGVLCWAWYSPDENKKYECIQHSFNLVIFKSYGKEKLEPF